MPKRYKEEGVIEFMGWKIKNGSWQNEPCNLQHVAISYFEELFTSDMVRSEGKVIRSVEQKVRDGENAELIHPFSDEKIRSVVFQIPATNHLGLMVLLPAFFRTIGRLWE